MIYDVIVIGAGVIGGMIAREMTKFNQTVCILERESDVACGASKANSGIVHGGYDPEPDTLKAKLNSRGVDLLYDAARELCVPVQKNGSMVCAFSPEDDAIIRELYNRGVSNHVSDMEILTGDAARELEPELSTKVSSVLRVKNAGIICPYELTIAAIGNAMDNGATLKLEFSVADITYADGRYLIWSDKGDLVEGKLLFNCAGGCADKIAGMIGDHSFKIIPRAGEYLLLDKDEGKRVRHTIFRTPSAQGKGILVTPTVDGNLLVGPTAEVVEQPCSTRTTQQGLDNVRTSASDIVPNIDYRNVITSFTGVRASEKRGDFLIEFSSAADRFINVAAIDSPGLTCSAAIAEYVKQLLDDAGLLPGPNISYIPFREDPHSFHNMSDEEKNVYIQLHPSYGKIICRCEGISEGEIIRVLQQNPPATDVDGVKRRTRSGMGRCQGGFCTPYVMKLIAQEREIPKEQVTKKGRGSEMVAGKR